MRFDKEIKCPMCEKNMEKSTYDEVMPSYKCNNDQCYLYANSIHHEAIQKISFQIQASIKIGKIKGIEAMLSTLSPDLCLCDYCPGEACHLLNSQSVNNVEICSVAIVEYLDKEGHTK